MNIITAENWRKKFITVVLVIFITAGLSMAGCHIDKNKDDIGNISFSSDGKKLLFERKNGTRPKMIQVYDLSTGELSAYQSPPDEVWKEARYSFEGKHIVLCIIPRKEKHYDINDMQIAIMDLDGKNVRKITHTSGPKIHPTFSHSGNAVIFAKGKVRESGRTPAAGFDIYEVDIKTGGETRLTWFDIFSLLPPPFELPDEKTIMFSAYGMPGLPRDLESKDNSYLVKKGDKKPPYPFIIPDSRNPLISDGNNTKKPLVSRDGKTIIFQAVALRPNSRYADAHQFFEYSRSGKYRRLTYLPPSQIWSADLSPDGQYLAVVYDPIHDESESKGVAICNLNNGTYWAVALPDEPLRILNQFQ